LISAGGVRVLAANTVEALRKIKAPRDLGMNYSLLHIVNDEGTIVRDVLFKPALSLA
jgi:hypothetical protein